MAVRARSLCGLGRTAEGRAVAAQLLRDAPSTPYASRMRAECAGP